MCKNVWLNYSRYGIGAVYQKQERYELAEIHFKRALKINHSNALIMCHVAVVSIMLVTIVLFDPNNTFHLVCQMYWIDSVLYSYSILCNNYFEFNVLYSIKNNSNCM